MGNSRGWVARDGSRPSFGQLPLKDCELLPRGALDDAEADEHRLEDSTANEGPTLELTYRSSPTSCTGSSCPGTTAARTRRSATSSCSQGASTSPTRAAVAARAIVDHPDTVSPDRVLPAALAELRKYGDLARTEAYGVLWRHAAVTERRGRPQRSLPHGGWYLIQYHLRSTFRSRENKASETTGARPCYTHALRHSLAGA